MGDRICHVINYCVWNCDKGIISVYDKIVINIKRENMENMEVKKFFCINLFLKYGLGMKFTAC